MGTSGFFEETSAPLSLMTTYRISAGFISLDSIFKHTVVKELRFAEIKRQWCHVVFFVSLNVSTGCQLYNFFCWIKSEAAGQICGRNLADLEQKGWKGDRTSENFVFLILFSLILGKYNKYYVPETHITLFPLLQT